MQSRGGAPLLAEAAAVENDASVSPIAAEEQSNKFVTTKGNHFRALMGKNMILKKREWSATCCPWCPFAALMELVLPMGILALLWWAKTKCNNGGQCVLPVLAGWGGQMPSDNKTTTCTPGLPIYTDVNGRSELTGHSTCKSWTQYYDRPIPVLDILAYLHWSQKYLALAVENPDDASKVEHVRQEIHRRWHPDVEMKDIPCVNLEGDVVNFTRHKKQPMPGPSPFKNYSNYSHDLPCRAHPRNPGVLPGFVNLTGSKIYSADELQQYLDSENYGNDVWGAVVFSSVGGNGELGAPGHWAYSIRLNVSAKNTPYTGMPKVQTLELGLKPEFSQMYLDKGFVALQLLFDRYIIGERSKKGDMDALLVQNGMHHILKNETNSTLESLSESLYYAPQAVDAVPMPVYPVVLDGFYALVSTAFPLVFIVAFLYTQKKVLNELIMEKETKVRESLRMLGINSFAIIGSWYVTYGLVFGVLCAIFTMIASIKIFPLASATVIFLFFWLWCMSFVGFAFAVHCFFNTARTGGIVGMLLMFAQWIVYAANMKNGAPPEWVMVLMCFLPNAAFCAGLDMLSKFEAAKVGATWSNTFLPINNSNLASVLLMMAVDVVAWTLLGWYLDQVVPKEFGIRQPLHFPCLKSYWLDHPHGMQNDFVDTNDRLQCGVVEEVAEAVRARSEASGTLVETVNLRREFSTPAGVKVAVAGLDLTMYQGQIFTLLGHNGAGKSTTINMLTGMVAPSSGDAAIAGNSIRTDMRQIRQMIGVCPQHDVLWAELTVLEHLRIYAHLRGIPTSEVQSRVLEMMEQVGLAEKAYTRSRALSGGQKRKLSLCLALAGRPRVIFLDEPTSGMDPYSRRATWNIIRSVREGCVTVLTTHFMDEADILGDRIAILAEGVLQCCGSSLYLKNRFGAGYHITFARLSSAPAVEASEKIVQTVKLHVPESQLLTNVGAELSMRLPTDAAEHFPALFSELDSRLTELQVEHYGMSMVTLEEVFLRVASGEIAQLNRANGVANDATGTAKSDTVDSNSHAANISVGPQAHDPEALLLQIPRGDEARSVRVLTLGKVALAMRHFGALFLKRARYTRRDFRSVACTVLLPVALLAFGLGLLQHVTNTHFPLLELSIQEQFGHTVEVPYNSNGTSWADALKAASSLSMVQSTAVSLNRSVAKSGYYFGSEYKDGLPYVAPCTPELCKKEKVCTKNKIWTVIESLQQVGIRMGCSTTQDKCESAVEGACQNDAAQCVSLCIARGGEGTSIQLCRQECKNMCAQKKMIEKVCLGIAVLGPKVSDICPEECGLCPAGTTCHEPKDPGALDATAMLAFEMELYADGKGRDLVHSHYGAVLATKNKSIDTGISILYNTSSVHAVPTFLNMATNAMKRATSGESSSITTSNFPMPLAANEKLEKVFNAVVNLIGTFDIIIAFSWIPAAIVAYIVRERESHHDSKHQQLISGVGIVAYWVSTYAWDICVYSIPLALTMLIIQLYDIDVFIEGGAFYASFVTYVGYGLAIAPFSYLLSFLFHKHTTAQVLCLVINFVTGLLLMLVSYILSAIDSTKDVNEDLQWVYRIFPGFCLGHGLFRICMNALAAKFANEAGAGVSAIDLLGWDIAGKDVCYLYVSAVVYFTLTIVIDSVLHSPWSAMGARFDPRVAAVTDGAQEEDDDVAAEELRITTDDTANDIVRLVRLRKVYRTPEGWPKVAVHGLSFGLQQGECFGFLGINGAGKTSTLNMLTGAILPSSGKAFLGGYDVVKQQKEVRRLLGYCPQHDALLDRLTVREHLELFGRIKGVRAASLRSYCDAMMRDLSLTEHASKLAMTLSGGNKRKLSVAIALMGSPPLVFFGRAQHWCGSSSSSLHVEDHFVCLDCPS